MSKTVPQDTAGIRSEQAGDLRRYLSVRWPRCPVFDSLRLRPYKTIPNRVGSVTRYARCIACHWTILTGKSAAMLSDGACGEKGGILTSSTRPLHCGEH